MTKAAGSATPSRPADAPPSWVDASPAWLQPLARLARWDRPVGWQLLLIPCLAGLPLARIGEGFEPRDALMAAAYLVGAIAMRGAGCTWNDIVDRDLDAQVERTRGRPLPAGQISVRGAGVFLVAQLLVGLAVFMLLPGLAQMIALAAVPAVLLYPLMKRVTGLPQVWLGLTFNTGALIAYAAAAGELSLEAVLLYIGLASWMVGYDTIYACQDADDDSVAGVKSSVLFFEANTRDAVLWFYAVGAVGPISAALALADPNFNGAVALAVFGGAAVGLILRQAVVMPWPNDADGELAERPDPADAATYLALFKSNVRVGLLLVAGIAAAAVLSDPSLVA